ncbi:MAG: hypothetical protein HKN43_15030 [Rhodothermales bacterium]|nr:hypothetical protein [Rhodothermales bacterium]
MDISGGHTRSAFLLSLLSLDGVGRAAAYKLFTAFDSFDDIRRYPDEQIATRLKRIPRVTSILEQLNQKEATEEAFKRHLAQVHSMEDKGISIITPDHESWPPFFGKISASARPPFLFAFGKTDLLDTPGVAMHIPESPAASSPFTVVVDRLSEQEIPLVVQEDDFARLPDAYRPLILVLRTGLESVQTATREIIKRVVNDGGLIISPFEMDHQHFRHDIPYLNTTVNGLGRVVVYADVPYEHPSFDEMLRLTESGLPIFAINMKQDLPDGVHPVHSAEDAEWILASIGAFDL